MNVYCKFGLIAMVSAAVLSLSVPAAEESPDIQPRMANGAVIEGTVKEATPDGLVIEGARGKYPAPWKYLSAGTRYRYERPMLAAQEVARSNALKKAAAASKAAATKAATNTPPAAAK